MNKKTLTDRTGLKYKRGTITNSGISVPVSSGFFVPHVKRSLFWRVKRAKYNTLRGNKPRRLFAVVETRHSYLAKLYKQEVSL